MTRSAHRRPHFVGRKRRAMSGLGAVAVLLAASLLLAAPMALSAQAPVGLGTARNFAVLAGSTVTNTGPSVISGSVGLAPGSAVTGFPPGIVLAGTMQVANGVALQAKNDLVTGYNDAAGRSSTATVSGDLAGRTLTPGVYTSASSLGLSGQLTLDAQGNPNAVFIFQAGSSLIVGSGSQVNLIGGAQACNVYWQVGSSATIGTGSTFVGNIMALTSITMTTAATLQGSALARNGAVTLDTNTITMATCATPSGGGSTPAGTTPGGTTTTTGSAPGTSSGPAGVKPKATKPKKHKPATKPATPKAKKPAARKPSKPVTPKPVIPTAPSPPAFTG
jgi:cell division septation protein DedD